jgi:regulator of nucleoside diphosphate kinase
MVQDIVITSFDLQRLQKQIETFEESGRFPQDAEYIETLKTELAKATVVDPAQVPDDVITMNSCVQLKDLDTKRQLEYTLVFPEKADSADRKVSILAPLGTALIGYRVGDTIEFKAPAGLRRLRVLGIIYQPEAAGDFTV